MYRTIKMKTALSLQKKKQQSISSSSNIEEKANQSQEEDPEGLSSDALSSLIEDNPISDLENRGVILIQKAIDRDAIGSVIAHILSKDLDPLFQGSLTIFINTEGGNLTDTWALIDVMESADLPITTVGIGSVCSAGTLILGAGDPGCRFVMPRTQLMSHLLSGGIVGNLEEMQADMNASKVEHNKMIEFWKTHSRYETKRAIEKYLLTKIDTYMTAVEAVNHGIVDKIIESKRAEKLKLFKKTQPRQKTKKKKKKK